MLRAILVLTIIAVGLRYAIRGAFYVLLFYLWIAYFRPEQWLWWDFVSSLNLSFIVGLSLVVFSLFSRERFRFGFGPALLFAFLGQSLLSTLLSPALGSSWWSWTEFARIVTVSYLLVVLVTSEERLRATLLVIALSLSFEGAKQGWAQLVLNPGATNTNTLPILGDNNGVAVGMLMLVPLLTALARTAPRRIERYAERFLAVGVVYRAISTYSRGGFLACCALSLHYLLRSKRKVVAAVVLIILAGLIVPMLPQAFWQRMRTIRSGTETTEQSTIDPSIAGRLHFWQVAVTMANDRPLVGVGQEAFNAMYDRYDFRHGDFGTGRSVHSAWFGILAELGYPGFAIFLLLIGRAFYVCWRAQHMKKARPDLANLAVYATAIEAALVVFAVGGSFVPFQYTEILWHFLALSMVVDRLVRERLTTAVSSPQISVIGPAGENAEWRRRAGLVSG